LPLFVQYILAFLGLVFAASYAVGTFRQGKNQEKIDTITILTADVNTLRAKVEELTLQIKTLQQENDNEKKKFVEAILLLQGKDTAMVDFIKNQTEFIMYAKLILIRVDKFLNAQKF
jgi:hypothetical protein